MSAESCSNLVAHSMRDWAPALSSQSDSLTVKEAELRDWDAFLERTPGGSYPQTSLWAMAKLMAGFRTRRFTITNGEAIRGGAQVMYRRLPLGGTIAYVPLGPVLASDDSEILNLAIAHIHRMARQENVCFLAVQP